MQATDDETKEPSGSRLQASWYPLRGDSASSVPGLQGHGDVVLLSFFDGIGSSLMALQSLGLRIRATLEWEVDPAALAVSANAGRCLRMKRGDITKDQPAQVAKILSDLLQGRNRLFWLRLPLRVQIIPLPTIPLKDARGLRDLCSLPSFNSCAMLRPR